MTNTTDYDPEKNGKGGTAEGNAVRAKRAQVIARQREARKALAEDIISFSNRVDGIHRTAAPMNGYERDELTAALTRLRSVVDCIYETSPRRLDI